MFSALIELEVTPLFEWLLPMLSRLKQERSPRLFSLPQLSFEHPPKLFIHSFFVLRPCGFPWPWHLLFIFRAWLLNPQYVFPSLIKLVSVLKFGLIPIEVNLDGPFLLFSFIPTFFLRLIFPISRFQLLSFSLLIPTLPLLQLPTLTFLSLLLPAFWLLYLLILICVSFQVRV